MGVKEWFRSKKDSYGRTIIYEDMVDIDKTVISLSSRQINGYEVFYMTLKMKDGKERKIRCFADNDNNFLKDNYKSLEDKLQLFFLDGMFGKDGVIANSANEYNVYLGTYWDGAVYRPNEQNLNEFNKNIDEIIRDVYTAEETEKRKKVQQPVTYQQPVTKNPPTETVQTKYKIQGDGNVKSPKGTETQGKTYFMSDIHGMYGSYAEAMKKLTPRDTVYIIGDVIDRGQYGIKILLDIINRQKNPSNNPKIIFLLGNHEMGMLQTISIMTSYGLNKRDIFNLYEYRNRKVAVGVYKGLKEGYNKEEKKQKESRLREFEPTYNAIKSKFNSISEDQIDASIKTISNWMTDGGFETLQSFSTENGLTVEQQNEIISFLANAYIAMPLIDKGERYIIVHSAPPEKNDYKSWNKIDAGEAIRYTDMENGQDNYFYKYMLSARGEDKDLYKSSKEKGYKAAICGHSPSEDGTICKGAGFIRIDGGCGHRRKGVAYNSDLILYNLTDDKVQIIDEEEYPGGTR